MKIIIRDKDAENAILRKALIELRDRIKAHPAYANLTEDEENEEGGDTAEFSYLVRLADTALGNSPSRNVDEF